MPEEIERHPLAGENGARLAIQMAECVTRLYQVTVPPLDADHQLRINHPERCPRRIQPGNNARVPGGNARLGPDISGHHIIRRDIAGPAKVFLQSVAHGWLHNEVGHWGQVGFCHDIRPFWWRARHRLKMPLPA